VSILRADGFPGNQPLAIAAHGSPPRDCQGGEYGADASSLRFSVSHGRANGRAAREGSGAWSRQGTARQGVQDQPGDALPVHQIAELQRSGTPYRARRGTAHAGSSYTEASFFFRRFQVSPVLVVNSDGLLPLVGASRAASPPLLPVFFPAVVALRFSFFRGFVCPQGQRSLAERGSSDPNQLCRCSE
jgi:hypothetical protein